MKGRLNIPRAAEQKKMSPFLAKLLEKHKRGNSVKRGPGCPRRIKPPAINARKEEEEIAKSNFLCCYDMIDDKCSEIEALSVYFDSFYQVHFSKKAPPIRRKRKTAPFSIPVVSRLPPHVPLRKRRATASSISKYSFLQGSTGFVKAGNAFIVPSPPCQPPPPPTYLIPQKFRVPISTVPKATSISNVDKTHTNNINGNSDDHNGSKNSLNLLLSAVDAQEKIDAEARTPPPKKCVTFAPNSGNKQEKIDLMRKEFKRSLMKKNNMKLYHCLHHVAKKHFRRQALKR